MQIDQENITPRYHEYKDDYIKENKFEKFDDDNDVKISQ